MLHGAYNAFFLALGSGNESCSLRIHDTVRIRVPTSLSSGQSRIRFSAFNKTWSILLEPNKRLFLSHFAVERRISNNVSIGMISPRLDCYYTGTIEGERPSFAVFSTCLGLVSASCMLSVYGLTSFCCRHIFTRLV